MAAIHRREREALCLRLSRPILGHRADHGWWRTRDLYGNYLSRRESKDSCVPTPCVKGRVIRDALGSSWPTVVKARSMSLDSSLYSVVDNDTRTGKTRRYVQVVGPTHHKRISLPLSGISRVSGNIRVVLDEEHKRAFIHVIYDVARLPRATGPAVALDWGITEVCTDSSGVHHGNEYGRALRSMAERRNKTGKARNKLHALSKRDAGSRRTKHIARNNLGTKKQQARLRRTKAQLQTISGATIKEVVYGEGNRTRAKKRVPQLPSQRPREIIIEDLSHLQGKV